MVTINHIPQEKCFNRYQIEGDNIEEVVTECISRIKHSSKEFYKRELYSDLNDSGKSIIDTYAGMGNTYLVVLNPQPVN